MRVIRRARDFPARRRTGAAAAALCALLAGGSVSATTVGAATAAVGGICYGDLPSRAHDTLDLIERGGPHPYEQDGTVFRSREGVLPSRTTGHHHEYTVITPGSGTRGARRVVTGEQSREDHCTADHHASFGLGDHGC